MFFVGVFAEFKDDSVQDRVIGLGLYTEKKLLLLVLAVASARI